MRRLSRLSLLLALLFLAGIVAPAWAQQDYSFQVPSETVNLYVNSDGTVSLEYSGYFPTIRVHILSITSMWPCQTAIMISTASLHRSMALPSPISKMTNNGITLGLGSLAIQSGSQGTVDMRVGTISGMLYTAQAQNSVDYAGLQFSPNWFNSQYAHGTTNLIFTVFLPSGMASTDPRYFNPQGWPGSQAPTTSGLLLKIGFITVRNVPALTL